MKAGESPPNQGRSVKAAPVRFQKAVSRSKEKRRSGAPRGERPASLGVRRKAFEMLPAPFGAPLPHVVRGFSPREPRGWKCPALPAPCENRGGGALAVLHAGCLKCESDNRARRVRRRRPAR